MSDLSKNLKQIGRVFIERAIESLEKSNEQLNTNVNSRGSSSNTDIKGDVYDTANKLVLDSYVSSIGKAAYIGDIYSEEGVEGKLPVLKNGTGYDAEFNGTVGGVLSGLIYNYDSGRINNIRTSIANGNTDEFKKARLILDPGNTTALTGSAKYYGDVYSTYYDDTDNDPSDAVLLIDSKNKSGNFPGGITANTNIRLTTGGKGSSNNGDTDTDYVGGKINFDYIAVTIGDKNDCYIGRTDKDLYIWNGNDKDDNIIIKTKAGSVIVEDTLNVTGNVNVTGDVNGNVTGNVDGIVGGTTPAAVTGTTITANTGFSGNVTGAVTGDVIGNLTGNVTGDVTGDVTGNAATATAAEPGSELANQLAAIPQGVPVGTIVMWSGDNNIPTNWALCDGQNATPDLRGRFVMGSGDGSREGNGIATIYKVGQSGGQETVTLDWSEMPVHNHDIEINDPGHKHTLNITHKSSGVNTQGSGERATDQYEDKNTTNSYTGIAATSKQSGEGKSHNNLPPYYVLAYIMYVGI
jgi:microcystin-dependent protein